MAHCSAASCATSQATAYSLSTWRFSSSARSAGISSVSGIGDISSNVGLHLRFGSPFQDRTAVRIALM